MTFTDNFTVGAWVKLSAYGSTNQVILSRYSSASNQGFMLRITPTGKLQLAVYNGSNVERDYDSYQSIPLNRWVFVAVSAGISASAYTTYLDGVAVPGSISFSVGTMTAITQAGDYCIGAFTGGSQLFNGNIAQGFVFSSVLSATTVRSYMSQGLTGSESTLVTAHSLSNSLNDLNATNANNLVAQSSASVTSPDSPFGGQAIGTISSTLDYGIVQKVTSTAVTVQVAEGCTIPTSGGVVAISYSTQRSPYGFPAQRTKWVIENLYFVALQQSSPTNGTVYNPGSYIVVPLGEWNLVGEGCIQGSGTSSITVLTGFSTASNSITETRTKREVVASSSAQFPGAPFYTSMPLSVTSAPTNYYLNLQTTQANMTTIQFNQDGTTTQIRLENAYV